MALRLIEFVLPDKECAEVRALLDARSFLDLRIVRLMENEKLVRILLEAEKCEGVLDLLESHYVVVALVDVRAGFDFAAVKQGDYSSVCSWLRQEWAAWREVTNYNGRRDGMHVDGQGRTIPAAAYPGIGRCELVPIRTTAKQAGRYLASYIGKGSVMRYEADKRARLVRYWGESRCVRLPFAWVGPRSWLNRAKMRQCALVEDKSASPGNANNASEAGRAITILQSNYPKMKSRSWRRVQQT